VSVLGCRVWKGVEGMRAWEGGGGGCVGVRGGGVYYEREEDGSGGV